MRIWIAGSYERQTCGFFVGIGATKEAAERDLHQQKLDSLCEGDTLETADLEWLDEEPREQEMQS